MRRWSGEKKHKYETASASVWVRSIMRFLMFDKHQHKIHRFCFAFANVFSAIHLVRLALEETFPSSLLLWLNFFCSLTAQEEALSRADFLAQCCQISGRERKRRRLEKVSSWSIRNRGSSFVCFQCSLHIALSFQRSLRDSFPTNFYNPQQSDFLFVSPMFIDHNFS